MKHTQTNWIPTLHQAQEYNELVLQGLTFDSKEDLQTYLDTLYHYDTDDADHVPSDYVDGVWKIIQSQQ